MTFIRRKFSSHIKAYLRFNYPYYGEPSDGLIDELGHEWYRIGNAKLVSKYSPSDETVSNAPYRGYRCLKTESAKDHIVTDGDFTLKANGALETEFMLCVLSSDSGEIVHFTHSTSDYILLSKNADNKLVLTVPALSINITSSSSLSLNTWTHIKAVLNNGTAKIFIDGAEKASGTYTANTSDRPYGGIQLGGIHGMIDTFIVRDVFSGSAVPSESIRGTCTYSECGIETETSALYSSGVKICGNVYAIIKSCSSATLTINVTDSYSPLFSAGRIVMIHVTQKRTSDESLLGLYAFRKIISVSGNTITLDKPVTEEFSLKDAVKNYYVQIIQACEYKVMTVGGHMYAQTFDTSKGGGIVFVVTGTKMRVYGKIQPASYDSENPGPANINEYHLAHSDLINRFIIGPRGGIYLYCGGTLEITSDATIGVSRTLNPAPPGYSTANSVGVTPGCTNPGGVNVIMIAKKLSVDFDALTTGGVNRGRTGLCYIACEEVV